MAKRFKQETYMVEQRGFFGNVGHGLFTLIKIGLVLFVLLVIIGALAH